MLFYAIMAHIFLKRLPMIKQQIQLKNETPDSEYTKFCNMCEKDGVFVACGNCDDKWIIVKFEDELDQLAWLTAKGLIEMSEATNGE